MNQATALITTRCIAGSNLSYPSRPVQYEGGGADTTATDIICPMYARVDEDQPFPAVPKWSIKRLSLPGRDAPADPLRIRPRDG
ncbi:glycoside hydrolase family 2 TIM barrel-domain containing protein [Escherichia coli]